MNQPQSLILTYKTEEPIPLETFNRSLIALQSEFSSITNHSSQLLVKEIRKGSFEIEFIVGLGIASLPLLNNINTVAQFFQYMQMTADWLLGKRSKPEEVKYSMKEIQEFRDLFAPISESKDSATTVLLVSGEETPLQITRDQSKSIIESVRKIAAKNEEPSPYVIKPRFLSKVLFYWNQTRFDEKSINVGNKGVIEEVDSHPRKVIFADDTSSTKHEMTTTNPVHGKDWQYIGYIVDVELVLKGETILAYKIIQNYQDDAIIE